MSIFHKLNVLFKAYTADMKAVSNNIDENDDENNDILKILNDRNMVQSQRYALELAEKYGD